MGTEKVQCGHCGAKRSNLQALKETYQDQGRFLVVRCLLCGWRVIDRDTSDYKPMGWSSPWPRRADEDCFHSWPLRADQLTRV